MTLDLGINIDNLFAQPVPATQVQVLAPMRDSDLELLGRGYDGQGLERITERHHALAKALASGMKQREAATLTGYAESRISILKRSPAFLDLIEMYRSAADAEFAKLNEQYAGLTKDAMLELRTRLESDPEAFSNKMLLEMLTQIGDRAGFAPVKRVESMNVNMSLSEKLALARSRLRDVTPPDADS